MPIMGEPVVSGAWGYALVDVDGVEHNMLTTGSYAVLDGLMGLLMPPVDIVDRELPLRAGSQLQGVRVRTREGDVPVLIEGDTLASVISRHELLLSWVDPTRGSVRWRVTRPDDTQRELICTYVGGFEGEERVDNGVQFWWQGVGSFRAHEPYWLDVTPTVRSYTLEEAGGSWFPMTFPITLAGSQIFRTTSENNTGSAETYPQWSIIGPGSNPILRNLTTGKMLGLTLSLAAGESLTIDMAPLVERPILDGYGISRFNLLTSLSERWPLIRGSQNIQIELTGADETSSVSMTYKRRWLRR